VVDTILQDVVIGSSKWVSPEMGYIPRWPFFKTIDFQVPTFLKQLGSERIMFRFHLAGQLKWVRNSVDEVAQ